MKILCKGRPSPIAWETRSDGITDENLTQPRPTRTAIYLYDIGDVFVVGGALLARDESTRFLIKPKASEVEMPSLCWANSIDFEIIDSSIDEMFWHPAVGGAAILSRIFSSSAHIESLTVPGAILDERIRRYFDGE